MWQGTTSLSYICFPPTPQKSQRQHLCSAAREAKYIKNQNTSTKPPSPTPTFSSPATRTNQFLPQPHTSLVSENTACGCQSTAPLSYYSHPLEERLLPSKALNCFNTPQLIYGNHGAENTRVTVAAFTTCPTRPAGSRTTGSTLAPQAARPLPSLLTAGYRSQNRPPPPAPPPKHHFAGKRSPTGAARSWVPGPAPPPPPEGGAEGHGRQKSRGFCPGGGPAARAGSGGQSPLRKGVWVPGAARRRLPPPHRRGGERGHPLSPPHPRRGSARSAEVPTHTHPHLPAAPLLLRPAPAARDALPCRSSLCRHGAARGRCAAPRAIPPSRGRPPPAWPPLPAAPSAAEPECARRAPLPGFSPAGGGGGWGEGGRGRARPQLGGRH